MKKIIFLLLFLFMSLIGIAQEINSSNKNKNHGFIYQQEGIYIFILCKPQLDYEFLGTIKNSNAIIKKSKHEMLNMLLEYCKKEYPNSEAIIISDINMEQADCIRLAD